MAEIQLTEYKMPKIETLEIKHDILSLQRRRVKMVGYSKVFAQHVG